MNVPAKINLAMQLVMMAFAEKIRIGKVSIPASTHSLRVGLSSIAYGCPIETVLGGFCHDLLEDTDVTEAEIYRLFGERVLQLTRSCTLDPALGDTEKGEDELLTRVALLAKDGDLQPLIIKTVDRLDNLRTNDTLKPAAQLKSIERSQRWLETGQQYLSGTRLVEDLRSALDWEKRRLTVAGVLE